MHEALVTALREAAARARACPEVAALVPPYLLREAANVIETADVIVAFDLLQKDLQRQEAAQLGGMHT